MTFLDPSYLADLELILLGYTRGLDTRLVRCSFRVKNVLINLVPSPIPSSKDNAENRAVYKTIPLPSTVCSKKVFASTES